MTPYSGGQPRRYPQRDIGSLLFYIASIKGLSATQRWILALVCDCAGRSPPGIFQPSLMALGKLCSCSRRTVMYAMKGLSGNHGWIVNDWRGGQKTNVYLPGWRLKKLLIRYRKKGV